MKLETRFTIILSVCLIIGLGISGLISYRVETAQARDELIHNAELMLESAMAIRSYTINQVRPLLRAHPTEDFQAQTVPSFAAQATLKGLKDKFPEFTYREAALNPTNTADRANDWEVSIIQGFRRDETRIETSGLIQTEDSTRYYVARPIRIKNEACLECHSTPAEAPQSLVAKYGAANGFGWKFDEVVGAQIVEVPADMATQKAMSSLVVSVGSLACIFMLTFIVFLFLFRRYVTRPLEHITLTAEQISLDQPVKGTAAAPVGGQFGALETAIDRLRTSVEHAVELLERNQKK